MNQIKFTLNPTKVLNPTIEASDNFMPQILKVVMECTTLEIDFLGAEKTTHKDGGYNMVCYTFSDLSPEKSAELERLAKAMAIFFQEAINHSKN